MPKYTPTPVASLSQSLLTTINQNFQDISEAMEKTLSRDGEGPNQMEFDFDANHNDIINVDNIHAANGVFDNIVVKGIDLNGVIDEIEATAVEVDADRVAAELAKTGAETARDEAEAFAESINPAQFVNTTGTQSIAGVKTFISNLVKINGLAPALDFEQNDGGPSWRWQGNGNSYSLLADVTSDGSYETQTLLINGVSQFGELFGSTILTAANGISELNVKALNADGGFTIDTGANASQTFNVNPFGGLFAAARAAHVFEAEGTTLNNSPRFTVAVTRKSLGSTANGPGQSSYAAWLHSEKTDWLNTLEDGEVDTGYILVNQGRKGDAGGLLIGARKVFGTAEDTGGVLLIEGSASRVDTTGTTTASIQTIVGFQPGVGGLSSGKGVGFSAEPRVGNAFAVLEGTERSDLTGSPSYEWLAVGSTSRSPSDIFAGITGSAHVGGRGRFLGPAGSATAPTFSRLDDLNTGVSFPAVDQVGFTTGGAFRAWATTVDFSTSVPIYMSRGTAIPAGGATAQGLRFSSTPNFGVFFGSGAPTLSAAQGSLYIRSDGSTTTNRAYINTDGANGWTAIQTAA